MPIKWTQKMDTFLEMYNFPRMNQEEIENMNRLITLNEVEENFPGGSFGKTPCSLCRRPRFDPWLEN